MDKFIRAYLNFAVRFTSLRDIAAVRKGFLYSMPLIAFGAIAVLINNLPLQPYQDFMVMIFGDSWKVFGANVWQGTIGIASFIVAFTVAHSIAVFHGKNPLLTALVSMSCLIMLFPATHGAWAIPLAWAGINGVFVSIAVAIVSSELFIRLQKIKFFRFGSSSKNPSDSENNLKLLLPTVITLTLFSLLRILILIFESESIHVFIFNFIQKLIGKTTDTLPFSIYLVSLINIFWYFGIHGSNVFGPIIEPTLIAFLDQNAAAAAAGQQPLFVATKVFYDTFVYIGGSGTTLALLISIYLAGIKQGSSNMKRVANLSIFPLVFNINEILIFGIPVILCPILIIPFIVAPIVLDIISYLAILYGIVPPTINSVAWTVPPIVSGYLATGSFLGSVLQVINLSVATAIYYPFTKMLFLATCDSSFWLTANQQKIEKQENLQKTPLKPKNEFSQIQKSIPKKTRLNTRPIKPTGPSIN